MKKIAYLCVLIVLFSCSDKTNTKNNQISEDSIGIRPNEVITFRKANEKMDWLQIRNDSLLTQIEYYPNGKIKLRAEYIQNKAVRKVEYYDDEKSNVKVISTFKFIKKYNDHIPIAILKYDPNGLLNKENSTFVEAVLSKDSINSNEQALITLNCYPGISIEEKNLIKIERLLFIGGFDEDFNIIDTIRMEVLQMDKSKNFKFSRKPEVIGNNRVYGVLVEKLVKKDNTFEINPYFFHLNFYVKGTSQLSYFDLNFSDYFVKNFFRKRNE